MVGKYHLRIEDKKVRYDLDIKRKYTLIKGSSAMGKTYLRDIIDDEGTVITCRLNVIALEKNELSYKSTLKDVSNSIIIIDEDVRGMTTKEFADLSKESDNYFIIFSRKKLASIPISLEEVYEFTSITKYNNINVPYTLTRLENLYYDLDTDKVTPELLITEDSKSGNQFFSNI